MKLEYVFISALLFGLIFVLGNSFYGEMLSNYDVEVDRSSTWGKMSYNLKSIYDYQDSMKDKVQGGSVTDTDAVDEMVRGGYTGIRTGPFNTIAVAANSTMVMAKEIGFIDPNIIGFAMAILTTLVLFAIIALIFRFRSD